MKRIHIVGIATCLLATASVFAQNTLDNAALKSESPMGVGVYGIGDTSNSFNDLNEGGYFEGGKGLYARGTDPVGAQGYGARIISDQYRGMFVQGGSGWFDAYFGGSGGVSAASYTDRAAATQSMVVNLGSSIIKPGDLVAMVDVARSPEAGLPMLGVAKLDISNRNAVIGVARNGLAIETRTIENGREYVDFSPSAGDILPDGYLVIITQGLAPAVNAASLELLAGGKVGDKVALSLQGQMALARNSANGLVIGRIAGSRSETAGTIPLFLSID